MSTPTIIIGHSGTGKSASLRNLDPANTLLIQAVKKPVPFKAKGWVYHAKETPGNIIHTDQAPDIIALMQKTKRKIIVIDDFQYILANEFMRRVLDRETGNAAFAKYNEIARSAWDIFVAAASLPEDVRVYILSHSQVDEDGQTKIKTIGKLLDEKIVLEGMVSIVLRTEIYNEQYFFRTKNNGSDTVKTPMGMFDEERIDNDLAILDAAICNYYHPQQ